MYGEKRVAELQPGGAEIEVTNANRREYVDSYAAYVLHTSIGPQFRAFDQGFQSVCGGPALELFHWEELELLICGSPNFDFEALQRTTEYDDGFTSSHPTIQCAPSRTSAAQRAAQLRWLGWRMRPLRADLLCARSRRPASSRAPSPRAQAFLGGAAQP